MAFRPFGNELGQRAFDDRHLLVTFYVRAHNAELPHSAFRGQTPDEMYFGGAEHVPEQLEQARRAAREARLAANRTLSCPSCPVAACPEKAAA